MRDMGGIPDIPPIPKPLSTKAFPKKMGGMRDRWITSQEISRRILLLWAQWGQEPLRPPTIDNQVGYDGRRVVFNVRSR